MRPLEWVGSSLDDLRRFPEAVRQEAGYGIYLAQHGSKSPRAVPLAGFGSAKVLEIIMDFDGNTFRAVYTVKFAKAVYVLHAFQKKSRRGIATPKPDLDLVNRRLVAAEKHYRATYETVISKGKGSP